MFSKGKQQAGTPADGVASAPQPPRSSGGGGVPSIISPDLKVHGNLTSEGDIQVDGTVEGDVTAGNLTVGDKGTIYGKVSAAIVRIRGTIKGEIHGESVTLLASAKVQGDIVHGSLSIEAGAWLEGHCRRQDTQPAARPAKETTPRSASSSERGGRRSANGSAAGEADTEPPQPVAAAAASKYAGSS